MEAEENFASTLFSLRRKEAIRTLSRRQRFGQSLLLERVNLPADDDEIMPPKAGPSPTPEGRSDPLDQSKNWPDGYQLHSQSVRSLALRKRPRAKNSAATSLSSSHSLTIQEDFNSIVVKPNTMTASRGVTRESSFALSQPGIVEWKDMILHPLKDGKTELKVTFKDKPNHPIEVQRASTDRPISFNLGVMPVFMRQVAIRDPAMDWHEGRIVSSFLCSDTTRKATTSGLHGRKEPVALTSPFPKKVYSSKKPSKRSPAVENYSKNSKHWQTLVGWLRDGAPQDPEDIAKPMDRVISTGRPFGRPRCLSANDRACSLLGRHHP